LEKDLIETLEIALPVIVLLNCCLGSAPDFCIKRWKCPHLAG